MITVIWWGLWTRRWSTLWWCVGVVALIAVIVLIYPAFRDQSALDQSLNNIPDAAKVLVTDTGDFFSPIGYMSSQLFYILLPLLLSILTIGLGGSLISQEEQDGTLELLLARPLARSSYIIGKAMVGLIVVSIVTLATIIVTVVCAKIANLDINSSYLIATCIDCAILSLLLGSITLFLSGVGVGGKVIARVVAGLIGFASYLISSLDKVADWLKLPAKLLPFHYYEPANILSGHYNWDSIIVFIIIILLLVGLTIVVFQSRDIE
jgi:ABC-2 type transport system permease protein